MDAAIEGDDVALRCLVRDTQSFLWGVCHALGSPGEEADLVQETYLRALRSLPSYRGDASVKAWLYAIARNVCADHVRQRTRVRHLHQRLVADSDERSESGPREPSVHLLLGQLGADQRDAFVLTQVLGFRYEEAAETLGCPIGTIRSRVARARAELAELVRAAEAM